LAEPALRLAVSPCPNDTYLFGPLALGWVSLPFPVEFVFEDIETLNRMALADPPELIKLSFAMLPEVAHRYEVFPVGAALGRGCGPLLVAHPSVPPEEIPSLPVALPGEHTTAHLLFRLAFPEASHRVFIPYHEILPALAEGRFAAGVIIHEGRFVYARYGLKLVLDLGRWWEEQTGLPIPLGGIFVRRDLPREVGRALLSGLRRSLDLARERFEDLLPFIRHHARELSREVIEAHIRTYVNEYTGDLGEEGRRALLELVRRAGTSSPENLFWEA